MIVPVFDLDGTLLDSDDALASAFVALGVPRERVTFGHVVAEECERLGLSVDAYLDAYDPTAAAPYEGVPELLSHLDRWAVCSNKRARSGRAELDRLGWKPEVALFAEAFEGPKALGPVLDALGLEPDQCIFVGDTEHDRACAAKLGVPFVVAAWNPRAAGIEGHAVLHHPLDLVELLGG